MTTALEQAAESTDPGCDALITRVVLRGRTPLDAALRDTVTETEPTFREDLLGDLDVVTLLTEPVTDLAERWRTNGAG